MFISNKINSGINRKAAGIIEVICGCAKRFYRVGGASSKCERRDYPLST